MSETGLPTTLRNNKAGMAMLMTNDPRTSMSSLRNGPQRVATKPTNTHA